MKRMLFNATHSEELRVAIVDGQRFAGAGDAGDDDQLHGGAEGRIGEREGVSVVSGPAGTST